METRTQIKEQFYNKKASIEKVEYTPTYITKQYDIFCFLDGNRNINKLHVNRLKQSMKQKYLFTLIMVNENLEVIDGQHRLEACKQLQLPVRYIIADGYGLAEVQRLNANSKTWNADDYMNGYCNLGFKNYIIYRDYKNKYGFGHNETQALLTGRFTRGKVTGFNDGNFEIKNLKYSIDKAETIIKVAPYYKGYKRRSFIYSLMHLLEKEQFNFNEFIKKLKIQSTKLVDCINQDQYTMLIEEIYNFKRKEKVNLRY
tara:strand:+ start:448 stop:1218 length:771 start_codon:yes stop_codon:yes gene_type:complete